MEKYISLYIKNIGRYVSKLSIVQKLEESGLVFRAVRKNLHKEFGYILFDNESERELARLKLEKITNKHGHAWIISDSHENQTKKLKKKNVKSANVDSNQQDKYSNATCPWSYISYEEQLIRKQKKMVKALKTCLKNLIRSEERTELKNIPLWAETRFKNSKKRTIDQSMNETCQNNKNIPSLHSEQSVSMFDDNNQTLKVEGMEHLSGDLPQTICPIDRILPSPVINGYRNKCSFTIGLSKNKKKTIGFRVGNAKYGDFDVFSPRENCPHVSDTMIDFINKLEPLIDESDFSVYDCSIKEGFWRSLILRHFDSSNSIQATFVIKISEVEKPVWMKEIERVLNQLIKKSPFKNAELKSFFVLPYDGLSIPDTNDPVNLIYGDKYVYEELNGIRYAVSPTAFFQVNSSAAEILYCRIRELALLEHSSTKPSKHNKILLDVCCGTGTIGISMAEHFNHLIGIDCNVNGIQDAIANVALNNISTKSTFVSAMIEDIIGGLCNRFQNVANSYESEQTAEIRMLLMADNSEVTVIVDPPRAGLHRRVIRELRRNHIIKRIVYVSCNPSGTMIDNVVAFCRQEHKQRPGRGFKVTRAIPIDLFPHTEHCEMVLLLERANDP